MELLSQTNDKDVYKVLIKKYSISTHCLLFMKNTLTIVSKLFLLNILKKSNCKNPSNRRIANEGGPVCQKLEKKCK